MIDKIISEADIKELVNSLSEVLDVNKCDIERAVEAAVPIIVWNVYDRIKSKVYLNKLMEIVLSSNLEDVDFSVNGLKRLNLNEGDDVLQNIFENSKESVIREIAEESTISVDKTHLLMEMVVLLVVAKANLAIRSMDDFDPQALINKVYKMRTNPILSRVMKTYISSTILPQSKASGGMFGDIFK